MDFKTVTYGSSEHQKALELRNQILRESLGLVMNYDEIKGEYKATHVVGYENNEIICGLYLNYQYDGNWDLEQVFVLPEHQKKGIGSTLLAFAEDYVSKHGGRAIQATTRVSAMGFYQKLGYTVKGEEFIKCTIPFVKMFKELS